MGYNSQIYLQEASKDAFQRAVIRLGYDTALDYTVSLEYLERVKVRGDSYLTLYGHRSQVLHYTVTTEAASGH